MVRSHAKTSHELRALLRYGIAVSLVILAYVVRLLVDPWLGSHVPLFTFIIATMVAALYLGVGPAILTMTGGFFWAEWAFTDPRQSWAIEPSFYSNVFAYAVLGFGSAILGQVLRRQRERLRGQVQEMARLLDRETAAQSALVESRRQLSDVAELSELRAREARYHEGRARESEETLALAVDCAALGTWDIDAKTGTVLWSGRAKQMLGIGAEDVVSLEQFLDLIHPDDRRNFEGGTRDSQAAAHAPIEWEFRTAAAGRTERWFRAKGRVFFDDLGSPRRLIGTMIDCTEEKRLTEEMRLARDSADSANQAKSAFLANMSHEIRTPLNAIMGFSEMLLDPSLSSNERSDCVSTISRNGQMLARLIDDILDLSKVEANKLEIERETLSLSTMLSEVAAVVADMARKGNVLVEMLTEPGVPESIESDPVRLRQILINIVGNAVKFTKNGKVKVSVRVVDRPTDHVTRLAFEIQDEGPGITPEHRPSLFRFFQQSDVSTTRRFGGTGLGLALSRRLARALGGDVRLVASEVGRGSTFLVTVSVGTPKARTRRLGAADGDAYPVYAGAAKGTRFEDLSGLRVLVVEDTPDSQFLIRRILLKAGAVVETASDGAEALDKAADMDFDAVLMDIQMPHVDGYEATATLRQRGFSNPIIALTAHAMKEDQERTLRSGFDDHVTKPIQPVSLVATVARHVERSSVN